MTQTVTRAPGGEQAAGRPASAARWLGAAARTTRPRQWPKNLLVFAAPLAGATTGRADGLAYAAVAAVAFGCASSAVYFVNDVLDAERDRRHPVKRYRPVASGDLPARHAWALAVVAAVIALAAGPAIGEPMLSAVTGGYLLSSCLYSARGKHIPYLEMALVALGFVLRVLAGAVVTHVPPSPWFLSVCSLGALSVAVAKRFAELTSLGSDAVRHRPVLRWYRARAIRVIQALVAAAMVVMYLMWAAGGSMAGGSAAGESAAARGWLVASAVPLCLALARFARLTGLRTVRPVEDMIIRDGWMLGCELAWLALFVVGLSQ